jgi:predicted P-loop ATPase
LREDKREEHELFLDHAAVFFFVGLMARLGAPGCRVEHLLVLEGGEGFAKTRALELLTRGHTAALYPNLATPAALESLRGAWAVEVHEPGLYDPGLLREFLFRRSDKTRTEFWRPAYGRLWCQVPRQCVFVLTGEVSDEVLLWRAMPIECGRIDLAALHRDREQLLGEAYHLYKERATAWWPQGDTRGLFAREQRGRRVQDPLTLRIERYTETHGHISVLEMLDSFNIPASQQSAALGRRAARILAARGYRLSEESSGAYWVDPGKTYLREGEILQ